MRAGLSDNVMISAKAQNLHHQQLIENQKDFLYKLIIRDYMNHTKKVFNTKRDSLREFRPQLSTH